MHDNILDNKVKYNEQEGYIYKDYVETTEPVEETPETTENPQTKPDTTTTEETKSDLKELQRLHK